MKKISILGLHLNYGGVEHAISNLANILCDDYEVELIISYKLVDKPVYKISNSVKIKYLMDIKPNRNEFKYAVKNKKIISIIKEGFKSLKTLYLRKKTMINYIKESDADIIISSRILFTKLLSKYAKKDVITIAQEHRHHNNDKKYIKKIKEDCYGINYLMPVSKELTDFYKKEIKNNRTKVVYIPHCLDYIPEKLAELTEKNIISIGRLSPEKGFGDLIDVFSLVNKEKQDWKLNIIGDGVEFDPINRKISELNLENNVIMHGFKDREYINKLFNQSSIYVMCSFEESFGLVLLEAQSFGIPCIAFDSAQGANEIIADNANGYLIKNRNKKEMSQKICNLINNQELRKTLGIKSRENSLNYSFETIKKEWLNFLSEIK